MGNAQVTDFPHLPGIFVSAMEAAPHSAHEATLRAAEIEIRPDEFVALVRGRPLDLTVRELALLTALVERNGRIVSREELYRVVWGDDYRKADRSVDVYVGKLQAEARQGVSAPPVHPHALRIRLPVRPGRGQDRRSSGPVLARPTPGLRSS